MTAADRTSWLIVLAVWAVLARGFAEGLRVEFEGIADAVSAAVPGGRR